MQRTVFIGKNYCKDKLDHQLELKLGQVEVGVKLGEGNLYCLKKKGEKMVSVEVSDVRDRVNASDKEKRIAVDQAVAAYEALPFDPLVRVPRAPFVDLMMRTSLLDLQKVDYCNYALWERPENGEQLFGFDVADFYHFVQVKRADLDNNNTSFAGHQAVKVSATAVVTSSENIMAYYFDRKPDRKQWAVVHANSPSFVSRAPVLSRDFICKDHALEHEGKFYLQSRGDGVDKRSLNMKSDSWKQRRAWTVGIGDGGYAFELRRVDHRTVKRAGVFVGITAAMAFDEDGLSVAFDVNGNMRYGSSPTSMTTFVPSHPFSVGGGGPSDGGGGELGQPCELLERLRLLKDTYKVDEFEGQREQSRKGCSGENPSQVPGYATFDLRGSFSVVRVTLDLHTYKKPNHTNHDGSTRVGEEIYDPLLIVDINPRDESVAEWRKGDEAVKNPVRRAPRAARRARSRARCARRPITSL